MKRFNQIAGPIRLLTLFALAWVLTFHSPARAQEKKLIIGYTARDLNNFPLFAAQARGFFKDAGKEVDLVQIRSNIGLSGLLGGSVDYYTSFSSAVTLAAQQASPIVGIFSMIERPSLYLVTRSRPITWIPFFNGMTEALRHLACPGTTGVEPIVFGDGIGVSLVFSMNR